MSGKAPQLFELTTAGRRHRVEITEGALRREIAWFVDDERVAVKKSSDEKVQLEAGVDGAADSRELGLVALRFTMLGRPRRVT